MRTRDVGRVVTAAATLVVVPTLAFAAPSHDRVARASYKLQDLAPGRLGSRYACALVPGIRVGRANDIRLLVTSADARRKARTLIAEVGANAFTTVRIVPPRFSATSFRHIARKLQTTKPSADIAVLGESNDRKTGCPRNGIGLQRPVSERDRAWAEYQQQRYGRDRVFIKELREQPRPEPTVQSRSAPSQRG